MLESLSCAETAQEKLTTLQDAIAIRANTLCTAISVIEVFSFSIITSLSQFLMIFSLLFSLSLNFLYSLISDPFYYFVCNRILLCFCRVSLFMKALVDDE